MLSKYRSKSQMGLYFPLENFERWPEGTYSFCPRCGLDMFELLYEADRQSYIRCSVCGAQWIIGTGSGICLDAALP
jgi:DNA-directed RNA polymerase subunit RPC12/RpoP